MQNARPSPSSCLPASGERPFNRTCVTGLKKKRDKASKHTDCISFFFFVFFFRFTTSSASPSPTLLQSPSSLFPRFLLLLCCVCLWSAFCWASGYVSIREPGREGSVSSMTTGRSIVSHTRTVSPGNIAFLLDLKKRTLIFFCAKPAGESENNPPHKLVNAACKQQKLLLFPCVEDAW